MAVNIEIDLFSGRVNPHWALSESETASLLTVLAGLTEIHEAGETPPPDLGYRGLRVHEGDKVTAIHGGWVRSASRLYVDENRAIELSLLEVMPETLASLRPLIAAQWG